jgi:hypothetical protein
LINIRSNLTQFRLCTINEPKAEVRLLEEVGLLTLGHCYPGVT